MSVDIRTATIDDLDEVATTLAEAFAKDPLAAWLYTDESLRDRQNEASYRYFAEHGYLHHGESQIIDGKAAALWMPVGTHLGDEFWTQHGAAYAATVGGDMERGLQFAELVVPHVPTEPHRYLFAIGVRAAGQGQGLGGALLDHALEAADANHEAAYLEATTPRSRALYERHGFEAIGQIYLPDGPALWPMWRPPSS